LRNATSEAFSLALNQRAYVRTHSAFGEVTAARVEIDYLGKALFWDMQLSSDGRVACATCHFHALADHRAQNQLSNPIGSFVPNGTRPQTRPAKRSGRRHASYPSC
jgi:cytochrome c peroxidase